MDKRQKVLSLLANSTRLRIIDFLKGGERCVCEIIPYAKRSQPNVSLHLKKLEEAGLLESRKEGTKVFYRIRDANITKILRLLE